MKRKCPASSRSGFFVSVGMPEEMSYFRDDNEPTFFQSRVSAFDSVGSLRRRLTCPHPFDADNVKPHSGGRSQSRTSSGTTTEHRPEPK